MKVLLTIPALMLAANVNAACVAARPTDAPAIPDGAVADEKTMYEAQEATKSYVADVEKFLECRSGDINVFEHNFFVTRAHEVAKSYNAELQEFRSREEALASS